MFVLKIRLYDIIVCSCINNNLFTNIAQIIFDHKLCFMATSIRFLLCIRSKIVNYLDQPLRHSYVISSVTLTLPFYSSVDIESGVNLDYNK